MANFTLLANQVPSEAELVRLYDSVGWSLYTAEPQRLHQAAERSLYVVSAYTDDVLVGLARVVGDGITIVYLQDILIDPTYQRQGLGNKLITAVFEPFSEVRQHILLTDDEPYQKAFYEAAGFTELPDMPHPLRTFVRFQ